MPNPHDAQEKDFQPNNADKEDRRAPASIITLLKAAGASFFPGLGHILIGQSAKGGIVVAVGLLFLLCWGWFGWWYLLWIVGALSFMGGGPALALIVIVALWVHGSIKEAKESGDWTEFLQLPCLVLPFVLLPVIVECPWPKLGFALLATFGVGWSIYRCRGAKNPEERRGVLGVTCLLLPFALVPAVVECPWPTHFFAWGLVAVADAVLTVMMLGGNKVSDNNAGSEWTLFGVLMMRLEPTRSVLSGMACLVCIALALFVNGWLFGPPPGMREQIVGTWELDDGDSVEFTPDGDSLYHNPNDSTHQGHYRLTGSRTLVIITRTGCLSKHTDRYTLEFVRPNELVLVTQEPFPLEKEWGSSWMERSVIWGFDWMIRLFGSPERVLFPTIGGKLTRKPDDRKPGAIAR